MRDVDGPDCVQSWLRRKVLSTAAGGSGHKTDQQHQHLQQQQQQQEKEQHKIELEIELSRNKNLWSGHLSQDEQLRFMFVL